MSSTRGTLAVEHAVTTNWPHLQMLTTNPTPIGLSSPRHPGVHPLTIPAGCLCRRAPPGSPFRKPLSLPFPSHLFLLLDRLPITIFIPTAATKATRSWAPHHTRLQAAHRHRTRLPVPLTLPNGVVFHDMRRILARHPHLAVDRLPLTDQSLLTSHHCLYTNARLMSIHVMGRIPTVSFFRPSSPLFTLVHQANLPTLCHPFLQWRICGEYARKIQLLYYGVYSRMTPPLSLKKIVGLRLGLGKAKIKLPIYLNQYSDLVFL